MTCFVCMDDTVISPKSECLCTDRFIHTSCLKKLIERTGQLQCPVCLMPYNVVTLKKKRHKITEEGIICALLIVAHLCTYFVFIVLFLSFTLSINQYIIISCLCSFLVFIVLSVTIWWLYTVWYYKLSMFAIEERIHVVSVPERIAL